MRRLPEYAAVAARLSRAERLALATVPCDELVLRAHVAEVGEPNAGADGRVSSKSVVEGHPLFGDEDGAAEVGEPAAAGRGVYVPARGVSETGLAGGACGTRRVWRAARAVSAWCAWCARVRV